MARAKSCKLRKAALAVAWSLRLCSARAAVVKPAPREKTSGAGKRNEPATRAIFRSFSIGTPGVLGIVIPDDIDFERIGEPAAESRGGHSGGYADTVRTRITQPAAGQEEQDEPRKRPAVPAVSACLPARQPARSRRYQWLVRPSSLSFASRSPGANSAEKRETAVPLYSANETGACRAPQIPQELVSA
jgi:hypothetical protein